MRSGFTHNYMRSATDEKDEINVPMALSVFRDGKECYVERFTVDNSV